MLVSDAKQARESKQAGALLLAHSTDAEILCGAFGQAMKNIKGSP
jgi:2-dehydro-3-deoxyglucarate aldolase/4-hydroxy-2-oxoheptanedioate aldolase